MLEDSRSHSWFALHIRMHDHEHIEQALSHKGFEVFAATYAAKRVIAGREKSIRTPLFPGYLFCSLDPNHRLPVLTVPGVISILGMGSSPTPIPTHEIDAVRRTISSGLPFEPFRLLQPGELVEVQSGPMKGVKGIVVNYKGRCRLVIVVSALNDRAVSVEVDRETVIRYDKPMSPPAGVVTLYRTEADSMKQWQYLPVDSRLSKRWAC